MKAKYISLNLFLCFAALFSSLKAEENFTAWQFSLNIQTGTDIGGAVPYPLKNIPSPFNAYPQLRPMLGGVLSMNLVDNFALAAELNYKRIQMNADARVENQRFKMDASSMYFTGTAKMEMDFTMLEIPLYVKYQFSKGVNRILLGGYYSRVLSGKFITIPTKGFAAEEPDFVDLEDMSGVVMDFSTDLDKWDVGAIIGYERKLIDRLNLGIHFSMGFKDVFKPSTDYFDYNMLHMRGSIKIAYQLFDLK